MEKLGNRALGDVYLPETDLVVALGAVILRISKDHEAAVRVGKVFPSLGGAPCSLGASLSQSPPLRFLG
jgi:hypothetical protein